MRSISSGAFHGSAVNVAVLTVSFRVLIRSHVACLLARVTLVGGEVNVVLAKRLWPRTVTGARPTDADPRAVTEAMERAALLRDARVDVVLGAGDERPPNTP
jgi:hypothetical protein